MLHRRLAKAGKMAGCSRFRFVPPLALGGLCLLAGRPALAAPSAGSGRDRHRPDSQALLRSGQEHASAKEWPQAVTDLQAARRAGLKDATVLTELSYALLMNRQIDQAQQVAQQAVRFAKSSDLKATGFYNLGRIFEARNKEPEALDAYTKSLKLRQDDETVRRIYQLDERSEAVPCRGARSTTEICGCLNKILGGSCVLEDDLHPAVQRLRSTWTPEGDHVGTSSAFLAVAAAEHWFLVSHLGRLSDSNPHRLIITNMKADVRAVGDRQLYRVEYTVMDNDLQCGVLGNAGVRGLSREYDLECLRESRHLVACISSADGNSVTCPVKAEVSCTYSKSARIHDELAGLSKSVRTQIRAWEARSKSSAKGELRFSESGVLKGTALTGKANSGGCPQAKPVEYRLF